MMKHFSTTRFLFAAAAGALLIVHTVQAEEDDDLGKLSAEVQKTVHKVIGSSKIDEVEPTYVDGKYATEVEFHRDGKEMAIVVSPEGKLIQTEERMAQKNMPEVIKSAVLKQFPKAKISRVTSVEKNGEVFFEVTISEGGKSQELKYDKNGKPLESAAKK